MNEKNTCTCFSLQSVHKEKVKKNIYIYTNLLAMKYEISLNINNEGTLRRVSRTRPIYMTFRELVSLLFQELVQRQHRPRLRLQLTQLSLKYNSRNQKIILSQRTHLRTRW